MSTLARAILGLGVLVGLLLTAVTTHLYLETEDLQDRLERWEDTDVQLREDWAFRNMGAGVHDPFTVHLAHQRVEEFLTSAEEDYTRPLPLGGYVNFVSLSLVADSLEFLSEGLGSGLVGEQDIRPYLQRVETILDLDKPLNQVRGEQRQDVLLTLRQVRERVNP